MPLDQIVRLVATDGRTPDVAQIAVGRYGMEVGVPNTLGHNMTADDLLEFTRAQPFRPFRIHGTDGRERDVLHPDEATVMRSRIVIPLGRRDGKVETLEHLSLAHIIRVEELVTASA